MDRNYTAYGPRSTPTYSPVGRRRLGTLPAVPARVAIDVGPLVGPLTGVGVAVDHLLDRLAALEPARRPELQRYVLSFRASLPAGVTRLRYPAALAHRVWSRSDLLRADRALGRPQVIHGTNYVVPPARCARLVSVYDCWFLRHPEGADPDVARAGDVLRRAVRTGAVVHASSHATANAVRAT